MTHPRPARMTPEEEAEFKRRRKGRNIALAVVLAFLVLLFYLITIAKMGG
ncbi:MAG: hypothetical protein ACK5NN_14960 [Sphingomonadaceae bacterium]